MPYNMSLLMILRITLLANAANAFHLSTSYGVQGFQLASLSKSHFLPSPHLSPSALQSTETNVETKSEGDASAIRSITFSGLQEDQEPQLLCNFLMELGACSTAITDSDKGTRDEQAIFHEFDTGTMTRTAVTTHVWNNCNVSAHFPASTDLQWIMEIVQETFEDLPKYSVEQVENKDWVLHVQQSWNPIVLPPFCLRFPWHSDDLVEQKLKESNVNVEDAVHIQLQGGIAFGTGEHPTTQLCLNWISNIIEKDSSQDDRVQLVMDYGAGSGVLGMAACKLDDTISAVGVDIDVDAVHIGNQNAEMNNVNMKNYLSDLVQTKDDESRSLLLKAYSSKEGDVAETLPDDMNGPIYDACVANILAGPLVSLAPILAGLLKAGGKLGLSGIMESQSDMILEAYKPFFDDVIVEDTEGIWVLVTGTKKE
ncbi:unnamed protein product [Cylindrotheca closterium]|uniref:ETFB lysine methyltransferase n=1 Tax=Cylindrotheca closterium TaxID=2856 RepID=A0AAD2JHQ8_9STRA|nr:unnamed protein product [Cylindrotheca closterium]